jgi:hypothetical protein
MCKMIVMLYETDGYPDSTKMLLHPRYLGIGLKFGTRRYSS